MDYHGLKLLWTWMYDVDGLNLNLSSTQIECKIKMIEVLSTMSIKNRTVLEEYKLLDMVKRWADQVDHSSTDIVKSSQGHIDDEGLVKQLMDEIVDKVVEQSNEANTELLRALRDKSRELYEKWSSLKVNFKIPKKQRIEERKEHERKLNSTTASVPSSSERDTFRLAETGSSAYDRNGYAQDRFGRDNTPRGECWPDLCSLPECICAHLLILIDLTVLFIYQGAIESIMDSTTTIMAVSGPILKGIIRIDGHRKVGGIQKVDTISVDS